MSGQFDWQDCVAAALIASGTTILIGAVRRSCEIGFKTKFQWYLRLAGRLPLKIVGDSGLVLGEAIRRCLGAGEREGDYRTIRAEVGGEDALSSARRAFTTAGISIAPNTYVLIADSERNLLLVHQLLPRGEKWAL